MIGELFILSLLAFTNIDGASVCCFPSQYHATQRLTKATVKNGHLSVLTSYRDVQFITGGGRPRGTSVQYFRHRVHYGVPFGSKVFQCTGTLQYWKDNVSRRETFVETLNIDGYDTTVTVIIDLNVTMTKYVISGTHCTKKTPSVWKDGCVQDWTTLMEESYFGKPGSGMNFRNYDNSAGSTKSYITVTKDECFPMFDVSVVPTGASPYMQAVQLHNFTVGIPDTSVFNIPDICNPSNPVGK